MWTAPIVAEIHQIRAQITAQTGDDSHALSLEAERAAKEAMEKFGMNWQAQNPAVPFAKVSTKVDE
jgi:hypothetical protein